MFFVLAEALPKTWAVLYAERAALVTARATLWPWSGSRRCGSSPAALIGLTNVLICRARA